MLILLDLSWDGPFAKEKQRKRDDRKKEDREIYRIQGERRGETLGGEMVGCLGSLC